MRERLVQMDVLKCVAIFLVLWGHAQSLVSGDYTARPVYYHIYSFHMPLFMMISGFFFAMTVGGSGSFASTFARKARQLLLPCAVCVVLFWLLDGLLFGDDMSLRGLLYSATHDIWFLKSAFICCMLGFLPFAAMKERGFWAAAAVTLIASQFIRTHQTAFMYPAFFVGGLICRDFDVFRRHSPAIFAVSGALCVVLNLFLDAPTYQWLLSRPKSMEEILTLRLYKYSMGLSGGVALMALAEWIFGRRSCGRWVRKIAGWGGMTLGIYLIQCFLLDDAMARFLRFDAVPAFLFDFVVSPAVALAVMYVSVLLIRLIRRSSVASLLLLGAAKRSSKS